MSMGYLRGHRKVRQKALAWNCKRKIQKNSGILQSNTFDAWPPLWASIKFTTLAIVRSMTLVTVILKRCDGLQFSCQHSALSKCIGDDTKAVARQSPNYIINEKNRIRRKTVFNMTDGILSPCNVARGSGMTCHWIPRNVRPIGILHSCDFYHYHRSRHVILHQSAKFYPNRTAFSIKNDFMSIFKMVDLRHLGF